MPHQGSRNDEEVQKPSSFDEKSHEPINIPEDGVQPPDEWASNPQNPVNWSRLRKWTVVILLWLAITIAFVLSFPDYYARPC